jgi:hypothetical protein
MAAIVQDYGHLFREDQAWHDRARRQAGRLIDFSTFVDEIARAIHHGPRRVPVRERARTWRGDAADRHRCARIGTTRNAGFECLLRLWRLVRR